MKSIIIGGLIGLSSAEPLELTGLANPIQEPLLSRSTRDAEPLEDQQRRYFQLTSMMDFFNPTFDERKYWTYGCNCLILGTYLTLKNRFEIEREIERKRGRLKF